MTDPLERTYRIHRLCAWRRVDDHVFILNNLDAFVTLADPVGLAVWEALEGGPCDGEALLRRVLSRFDVAPEEARRDLAEFLVTLLADRGVEEA